MTMQLDTWRGAFGDAYVDRNQADDDALGARTRMWARMLERLGPLGPVLEVGANIGLNLRALQRLGVRDLTAVEPNAKARATLAADGVLPAERVHDAFGAGLPFADGAFDLVFTSGVLIHVPPADLEATMREIVRTSRRYVACAEYFSVEPQEKRYRGAEGLLFTRDFGGAYLDLEPRLELVDYGFFWRRATGLDDLTWQVFAKR
jgi:spore coat polysaccharide biosynthesis protein SpsF